MLLLSPTSSLFLFLFLFLVLSLSRSGPFFLFFGQTSYLIALPASYFSSSDALVLLVHLCASSVLVEHRNKELSQYQQFRTILVSGEGDG